MQLNINTDAVVKYTAKLEKLHKSALPSAIRGALNKAVFDVKTNTIPRETSSKFKKRQPNFFKANSKFENAVGFNINKMRASVGFIEGGLKGSNNHAVKDLEDQESGGTINKRSFVPLKQSRISTNNDKNVKSNYRLSQIKKIIDVRTVTGKNRRSRFIKAMITAGKNGYVLSGKTLWKVNTIKRKGQGFSKTPLYNFKQGRSVRIKPTGFMHSASMGSAKKINQYFIDEAIRQVKKLISK